MKVLRNIVALFALVVILMLAFANAEPVRLTACGYHSPELPLFLYLLTAFILGFLLAALTGAVRQSALRRQITRLERDIAQLRSAPRDDGRGQGSAGSPPMPN
jgi:uncharacterized integral membrane protein